MHSADQNISSKELLQFTWFIFISCFFADRESVLEEPGRSIAVLFPPESEDEFQIIFVAVERNLELLELVSPDSQVQVPFSIFGIY